MRQLLLSADTLAHGTFVKTDSPQIIELLGTTRLDFAVIDAEHAPFDRITLDRMLLAGRAADLPLLVRVPDSEAATIQSVLDMGAAGILVPQVDSADHARALVSRAKFRGGSRGFSISPRSASYGTIPRADVLRQGDTTKILCQIESQGGLDQVAAIAAISGVDALFIGRADLALSMGLDDPRAPAVAAAVVKIAMAARHAGKVCGMHVSDIDEARRFAGQGITWFVISSDQGLLQKAGQAIARGPLDVPRPSTTPFRLSESGGEMLPVRRMPS